MVSSVFTIWGIHFGNPRSLGLEEGRNQLYLMLKACSGFSRGDQGPGGRLTVALYIHPQSQLHYFCCAAIFLKYFIFFIILSLQKNTKKNYYKNIQGLVKVRKPKDPTLRPCWISLPLAPSLFDLYTTVGVGWGHTGIKRLEIPHAASMKGKK